jgi:aspartyl-tRNA synthetase
MRTLIADIVSKKGEEVELMGWVNIRRDHGKIIFIDLRDRTAVVQLVIVPSEAAAYEAASRSRAEWVLRVKGKVSERPAKLVNPNIATGSVEVQVSEIEVLNEAEALPFPIDTDGLDIAEETRLLYRYLDLRRPRLQRNIALRSVFVDRIRQFLFSKGFNEIETPMLTKSTPEGSRDFVVPSRLHPGKFFALPQSPQQYKQLLMVAGFERYFQIARCVRDEDLRADRGFEHTQIDFEMSFVEREDVMALDEEMMTTVCESLGYTIKQKPFPRFSYAEAIAKFGADKFDLRTEEDKKNGILAFAWVIDFPFFERDSEGNWTFTHNPFSHPKAEHVEDLLAGKNIDKIITTQYDLVCNGYETGGGSIRAHKPDLLRAVFRILGHSDEKIDAQFGHMLKALSLGAPPHGGLAHGIERLIMILTGEQYLREVQAFPQTSSGRTSVMDAPSELEPKQLTELSIRVDKPEEKKKK